MKKLFLIVLAITSINVLATTSRLPGRNVTHATDTFLNHTRQNGVPSTIPFIENPNRSSTKAERIASAHRLYQARIAQEKYVRTTPTAKVQPSTTLSTDPRATRLAIAITIINNTVENFDALTITQNNQITIAITLEN